MLGKHAIFPFSSINYTFSMDYISLQNFSYIFEIISMFGVSSVRNVYIQTWFDKELDAGQVDALVGVELIQLVFARHS